MFRKSAILMSLLLAFAAPSYAANGTCELKNLEVMCANGEKIKFDVTRSASDVYLTVKAKKALGDYILLYINGNKPEVLPIGSAALPAKRAQLSYSLISKLKNATSLQFQIVMNKGKPISGSLGQDHFQWLKQFGAKCS